MNRINQKNSWNLNLIDHMGAIVLRAHQHFNQNKTKKKKYKSINSISYKSRKSFSVDNNFYSNTNQNKKQKKTKKKLRNKNKSLISSSTSISTSDDNCVRKALADSPLLSSKSNIVNFTTASATLAVAAKIYSCRVDNVHKDIYRILNTLSDVKQHKPRSEQKSNENEIRENERQIFLKRYKFKKNEFHFRKYLKIHKNDGKMLNFKRLEYLNKEINVDPLFHKMSTLFDMQGANGLLLNHLFCSTNELNIVMDSEQIYHSQCFGSGHQCNHEKESQVLFIFCFLFAMLAHAMVVRSS